MPTTDLYELLGVRRDASPAEVRRGYEQALSRANRQGATRHMLDLVQAHDVLSDASRRRLYDGTGVVAVRERRPNTYGRAVPFRGSLPGLGAPRRSHVSPRLLSSRPQVRLFVGDACWVRWSCWPWQA